MRLLLLFFLSKSKICRWQVPLAVYVVLISQSVYANKIYLEIVINFYPTKRRMKMAIFNRNSFVQKTRITIQYCGANLLWNTRLVFSLNIWPIKDIKTRIIKATRMEERTNEIDIYQREIVERNMSSNRGMVSIYYMRVAVDSCSGM